MILEKNNIYKVKHPIMFTHIGWDNIIIFSPMYDIEMPDNYFASNYVGLIVPPFNTNFTVCFDKSVTTQYDLKPSQTAVGCNCVFVHIKDIDLPLIMNAMGKMGHGWKYNRKLNKIIQYESNK